MTSDKELFCHRLFTGDKADLLNLRRRWRTSLPRHRRRRRRRRLRRATLVALLRTRRRTTRVRRRGRACAGSSGSRSRPGASPAPAAASGATSETASARRPAVRRDSTSPRWRSCSVSLSRRRPQSTASCGVHQTTSRPATERNTATRFDTALQASSIRYSYISCRDNPASSKMLKNLILFSAILRCGSQKSNFVATLLLLLPDCQCPVILLSLFNLALQQRSYFPDLLSVCSCIAIFF